MKNFELKLSTFKALISKVSALISRFCFPLLVVISVCGFFSEFGWMFNLCSHFPVQYMFGFFCFGIWFVRKRMFLNLSIASIFLILNIVQILPYVQNGNVKRAKGGVPVRLMQMNVFKFNSDFARIASVIEGQSPDIIAFEEFNNDIHQGLLGRHCLQQFSQKIICPNPSSDSEIALFSKLPIENSSIIFASPQGDPSIIAHLKASSGENITIIVMHPRPPATPHYLQRQEQQLRAVAAHRKDFGERIIVLGDLNTSPWAFPFKVFSKTMNLVDPRVGRGLAPTWPIYVPVIMIPIDFILSTPNIQIVEFQLAEFTASDHLPVVLDCYL